MPKNILSQSLGIPLTAGDAEALTGFPYREVSFKRGATLPLDPDSLFAIVQGWVCASKTLTDGQRQIYAIHIDGDAPDFRRLLLAAADEEYRALNVCRVGFLPTAALQRLCDRSPLVTQALMRKVAIMAAISEEWVVNVGARRAINRVGHLLCELGERLDVVKGVQSVHVFPLTQTDIAEATGLSTVHVNRVLQSLRAMQLIELGGGRMVLRDRQRLAEFAGFNSAYLHLGTRLRSSARTE